MKRALLVLGLLAFLVGYTWAMREFFTSVVPGANDFYARWAPLRAFLLTGRSPYSEEASRATQIGMYGHPARPDQDKGFFSYPLFSLIFFGPFALIADYAWASAAWLVLLQIALLALAALSLRWANWTPPPGRLLFSLLFGLLWYPAARTLLLGQFAGIEALLLVAALLAVRAERDGWAGLLLALAMVKPQMAVFLLPGLLLWSVYRRRWRLPLSFGLSLAAMLAFSLAWRPAWPGEWLAQLSGYVDNSFIPGPVAIVAGYFPAGLSRWVELVLNAGLLAYMLWTWRQARRSAAAFDWAVAVTLVISNLAAVRTATTNYVMLTPALFWVFAVWERQRRGAWIVAAQVAWLVGLWVLFFLTVRGDVEQAPMYLPLPWLLLAALVWLRPGAAT